MLSSVDSITYIILMIIDSKYWIKQTENNKINVYIRQSHSKSKRNSDSPSMITLKPSLSIFSESYKTKSSL